MLTFYLALYHLYCLVFYLLYPGHICKKAYRLYILGVDKAPGFIGV